MILYLRILFITLIILICYQIAMIFYKICFFIYKYGLIKEKHLLERYGYKSWVCITGCSSGQGKHFAIKFAKRGFNILLIGSPRIKNVEADLNKYYPKIKTKCIIKDFSNGFKKNFFNSIEKVFKKIDLSILINNVGHRTAWIPYHEMPEDKIRNTITVGTIIQSRLTQLAIPKFLERKNRYKSAIINMTAQCMHMNLGVGVSNEISVPYMSVYEASNAFGFYHSNSIYHEYMDPKYDDFLDMLTITPGAVVTENTQFLKNTIFSIKADEYVDNIIRLLGNVQGIHNAHWGHSMSTIFINMAPFLKNTILKDVGKTIATNIMQTN